MRFEYFKDRKGEYRWRIRSRNGRIVADSAEGYYDKSGCTRSIRGFQRSMKKGAHPAYWPIIPVKA